MGRPFRDLVHPEDLAVVVADQERLARGEPVAFEARLRTAEGDHRWMSIRVKPLFDDDGRIVGRVAGWWDSQRAHEAMERLARQREPLPPAAREQHRRGVPGQRRGADLDLAGHRGGDRLAAGRARRQDHARTSGTPTTSRRWPPCAEGAYGGLQGRDVLRFRRTDGQYLWMEVAARPYVERDGGDRCRSG